MQSWFYCSELLINIAALPKRRQRDSHMPVTFLSHSIVRVQKSALFVTAAVTVGHGGASFVAESFLFGINDNVSALA